jgi:hypothetical protein
MTELNDLTNEQIISAIKDNENNISVLSLAVKKLKNELLNRLNERIESAYKDKSEPYGDITLDVNGIKLKINKPKKVDWDQTMLSSLYDNIKKDGDNPADYIDVDYSGSEKKYAAWGGNLRSHFINARTIKPSNLSIKIVEEKE